MQELQCAERSLVAKLHSSSFKTSSEFAKELDELNTVREPLLTCQWEKVNISA